MSTLRFVLTILAMSVVCAAHSAPFQQPTKPYTFDVPAGWAARSLDDGTIVTSRDAYVRIVKVPGGGKDDLLIKRVIDQIGEQWSKFKQDERGQAKLGGSTGIYFFISGVNPKGVEATLRIVAAPFGDDAYMLFISAPTRDFVSNNEAFKQIEHSFALESGGATSANSSEQPARAAGSGLKAIAEAGGGHVLFRPLTGVSSGKDAFRSGLAEISGYFDSTPKLLSVVTSKDHNITISVFNASLHGSAVAGFATATYDPAGNSNFAVVYDDPNHLKSSLTPMMHHVHELAVAAIERSRPAGGGPSLDFARFAAAADKVTLTRTQYPGGIGSIGIAPGYTPHLLATGTCVAFGEDGASMNLMGFAGMSDPRGTGYKSKKLVERLAGPNFHPVPDGKVWIEYDPNPVSAWKKYVTESSRLRGTPDMNPQVLHEQPMTGVSDGWTGRLVSGTMTVNGETFAFTGSLMTSPPPTAVGAWALSVTILRAPIKNAAADFPPLIAMQKSVKLDLGVLQDNANRVMAQMNEQTNRWLAENKAAGDAARERSVGISMANARASRDAMDRSTAGFINHILDRSVVQHNPTGAHATTDIGLANALERSDPQNFSPVPISQYVKGIDY